jgi:glycine cleavage system H protein
MDPMSLKYAPTHEWARPEDGVVVVGITKFAVELLTDLVYIALPSVGTVTQKGKSFGEIESVKAVSDLYAPVDGEVVAINNSVADDPKKISDDPFGTGWLIKIKPAAGATLDHLMDVEAYEKQLASEGH